MKWEYLFGLLFLTQAITSCKPSGKTWSMDVYETSASGNKLQPIEPAASSGEAILLTIKPETTFQRITGFGGAFTESSAYLLNRMSPEKRKEIITAYFSEQGAQYSLTRTHINSCDFSLSQYSYAPVPGDRNLEHFSIDEDRGDLIPMIKEAQQASREGFKIIASPWTAPPWMKDNQAWVGGKLLPEYRDTWAGIFQNTLAPTKRKVSAFGGLPWKMSRMGTGTTGKACCLRPRK